MRIKIPAPVNLLLDAAAHHRLAIAAAVVIVLAGGAAALWRMSPQLAWAAGGVLLGYVAVAYHLIQIGGRDERIKQLEYDKAALFEENKTLKQGDPSGPTATFLAIRDVGEGT